MSLLRAAFLLAPVVAPCVSSVLWENAGQVRDTDGNPCPEVLFVAEEPDFLFFVRTQGFSYVFVQLLPDEGTSPYQRRFLLRRVDVEWLGANPFFQWDGEEIASPLCYYYHPLTPGTSARPYRSVRLRGLYPGIELRVYWTVQGQLKYDLIAERAEALSAVRFRYIGAESIQLEAAGSVRVTTSLGTLRELSPVAYQDRRSLRGVYLLRGDTLSFAVPEALPHLPIVFDPGVVWSTYYGGGQMEDFQSVATDRAGNAYVAGWSISPDFPVRNALQSALATTVASDAVIAKFSPTGQPLWATYYGGDSIEVAHGIACDSIGNAVVVGTTTSPNFPTQNAFQSSLSGISDAFILRLNANGQRVWATYYGGSNGEVAYGAAYDRSGSTLFIGGSTSSTNFPIANALQTSHGGGTLDGFVLKFSLTGQRLWATYYGGAGEDDLRGVAADSTGAVVAAGSTTSTNFPVQNALQTNFAGGTSDAFVLKLSGAGQRLWATYYGGNRQDIANSVAVDSRNLISFGGASLSDTIPLLNAVQSRRSAALDAFLTCLDSLGRLQWGTFYGGNAMEEVRGIAVARNRWVIACGYTYSSNFPRWLSLQPYSGSGDAFLIMFHYVGTLQWSTPFGSTGYDIFNGVATDTGVSFYACGSTTGSNFPINSAFQAQLRGSSDAVLTRFDRETIRCRVLRQPLCAGDTAGIECIATGSFFPDNSFTAVLSDSSGDFARSTLIGELPGQTVGRILARIPDTMPAGKRYRIRVLASSPVTIGEATEPLVILRPPVPPVITVFPDTLLCPGDSAVLQIEPQEMATYTWRRHNVPITGANSPRLVARQPGRYTVEVLTPCGTVTATEIVLTAGAPPAVPRITVSGQTRFCRGDSLVLSASPQPGVSYHWYSNGHPFGSDTATIVVREPGTYTLAVQNGCGITWSRDTIHVRVDEPLQKPSLTVVGETRFCQGDSSVLLTERQPTVEEYRWYRNGTLVLRNPQAWSYTVRQPGWYSVEVLNTCGNVRSDSLAIDVLRPPTPPRIMVEGGVILCSGDSTILSTAEQPETQYRWYRDGQLVDTSGFRYVARQPGTYTVEVVSVCGRARSPDSVTIRVLDTLPIPRLHAEGYQELCEGDSLWLRIDPVGGARYEWYRDGSLIGTDTPAIVVRSAGTYWVRLSSPCGEVSSDSITVTVTPRPRPPVLSVEGSLPLCEGDSLRLSISLAPGVVYAWYRNDSLLRRNAASLTIGAAGVYWVTASNRCGEARSESVTVTVVPRPPQPAIRQEGDTLISSSPVGNQWLDSAGAPIPGATGQRFVPPRSGQYRVRVTIDGCSAESEPYNFIRQIEPAVLRLHGGKAPPGAVVELPLTLQVPPTGIAASKVQLVLRYWAQVLEPLPPTPPGTLSQGWRTIPLEISTAPLPPGKATLLQLPFRVLLGNRDRTPLLLEQITWLGSTPPTEVVLDSFVVEICREGGDRLFVPTEARTFVEVLPHPATTEATVRFGIPESGTVRIHIWNLCGQEVAAPLNRLFPAGIHEEPLRLPSLPAGLYLLTFRTPSHLLCIPLQYVP
ncbi:MAG: SBBP repeat-containing protein [Bacteroidota bacterium]|nr:SBBP repeat-containing protein [Bacteroidota bacterium]